MLLDGCPLAGESTAEELAPAEQSLFFAQSSNSRVVMVVEETNGAIKDFILEGREESGLQSRGGMIVLVELL